MYTYIRYTVRKSIDRLDRLIRLAFLIFFDVNSVLFIGD